MFGVSTASEMAASFADTLRPEGLVSTSEPKGFALNISSVASCVPGRTVISVDITSPYPSEREPASYREPLASFLRIESPIAPRSSAVDSSDSWPPLADASDCRNAVASSVESGSTRLSTYHPLAAKLSATPGRWLMCRVKSASLEPPATTWTDEPGAASWTARMERISDNASTTLVRLEAGVWSIDSMLLSNSGRRTLLPRNGPTTSVGLSRVENAMKSSSLRVAINPTRD